MTIKTSSWHSYRYDKYLLLVRMCGVLGETHISQELPVLYNENGNAKLYRLFEIDRREFLIIQGIFQRKSTKKGGNDFQWSDRVLFIVFPSHFSPIPDTSSVLSAW